MPDPSHALALFDLKPTNIVRINGGLETMVWRVDTDHGTVAIRRHPPADHAKVLIASELEWLNALDVAGQTLAPRPLPSGDAWLGPALEKDSSGQIVAIWSALSWVDGQPLERLPSAGEVRAIGRLLAAMHAQARAWAPPAGLVRPLYGSMLFKHRAEELLRRTQDSLAASERRTIERGLALGCVVLDTLWASRQDIGIIHADVHAGNLMWAEGRDGPAAIDFGRCGLAPLILDVAMTQHYLPSDLADALLEEYVSAGGTCPAHPAKVAGLRFLAAIENVAILSRFPEESVNVREELRWLVQEGQSLTT